MTTEEGIQIIRDGVNSGQDVCDKINDVQKEIFVKLGVDGAHGIQCLGQFQKHFADDKEMLQTLARFISAEELVASKAECEPGMFEKLQEARQGMMQLNMQVVKTHCNPNDPRAAQQFQMNMQKMLMEWTKGYAANKGLQVSAQGQFNPPMKAPEELQFYQYLQTQLKEQYNV